MVEVKKVLGPGPSGGESMADKDARVPSLSHSARNMAKKKFSMLDERVSSQGVAGLRVAGSKKVKNGQGEHSKKRSPAASKENGQEALF